MSLHVRESSICNKDVNRYLFQVHALEPTIDTVTKQSKHYKDQEYNPSWQQIWWLFWCTECSPSGKASSTATMEALEESSGPPLSSNIANSSLSTSAGEIPSFPTSQKQTKYLSRADIDKKNKQQRMVAVDGQCEHVWCAHVLPLNGMPALFCKKCALMKQAIIEGFTSPTSSDLSLSSPLQSAQASINKETSSEKMPPHVTEQSSIDHNPSSEKMVTLPVAIFGSRLIAPSSSVDSGECSSKNCHKKLNLEYGETGLFSESSSGDDDTAPGQSGKTFNIFSKYHKALQSLQKTVWNTNIERRVSNCTISFCCLV